MRSTLYTNSLVRVALTSATRTNGTVNGTTVDLGVFGNDFRSVLFVVQTGTVTDGSHAISVQDSPDGSAWAAVDAAQLQGTAPTITSTNDDTVLEVGYIPGTKQYVRLVAVTSGATTGGVFAAVAVLGEASSRPVARS
jgi:hypothetical protein